LFENTSIFFCAHIFFVKKSASECKYTLNGNVFKFRDGLDILPFLYPVSGKLSNSGAGQTEDPRPDFRSLIGYQILNPDFPGYPAHHCV